jgi:hypothetical protein
MPSDRRRRPQTVWVRREPPINDAFEVWIDIEHFRTMLDDGRTMPGRVRLMFEIAVRSGRMMMTIGELKPLVLHAIATSGTTRAAIRAVRSGELKEMFVKTPRIKRSISTTAT